MPQSVYLYLSSGTANGPYSVYTSSVSLANRLESGLTFAQLQAGRFYSVPDNSDTVFIVVNDNEACGNQQTLTVVAVSPSPTPTPTRTPSITVTPSITPSRTVSVTVTPSITPSRTVSRTPTPTPTRTPSVTPSLSLNVTPTPTPSITVTPSRTPSITPSPSTAPGNFIYVQLNNDANSICIAGYSFAYLNSTDYSLYLSSGLQPGMILYSSINLMSVIQGYSFVRDDVYFITYNLDTNTGEVGSQASTQC